MSRLKPWIWNWKTAALAASVGVVAVVWLGPVLLPIAAAWLLAYLLHPIVDRLEDRSVPRWVAVGLVVVGLTVALVTSLLVLLFFVMPWIVGQLKELFRELPEAAERAFYRLQVWAVEAHVTLPHSLQDVYVELQQNAQELAAKLLAPAGTVLTWVLGGTVTVLAILATAAVVLAFACYFLIDWKRLRGRWSEKIPERFQSRVDAASIDIQKSLRGYLLGQLLVMAIDATLYSMGFTAIGLRLSIVIGCVGGLVAFIPYIGGAITLSFALFIALIDWTGWGKVIGVLSVYAMVQGLDGFLVSPRVYGRQLGLSPAWILFAMLTGAHLFGFLGLMLAVPSAAVGKILYKHVNLWLEERQQVTKELP